MVDMDECKQDMDIMDNMQRKNIECNVLNGRKIHVKAILDVDAKISSNENVEYVKEINNLKDIQCLNREFQISSLVGKRKY